LDWWLANNGATWVCFFHKYDEGDIGDFSDTQMFNRAETFMVNTDTYYYGVSDISRIYYNARGKTIQVIDSESNFDSLMQQEQIQKYSKWRSVWYAMKIRADILSGLDYDVSFAFSSSIIYSAGSQTGGYGLGMINSDNYSLGTSTM